MRHEVPLTAPTSLATGGCSVLSKERVDLDLHEERRADESGHADHGRGRDGDVTTLQRDVEDLLQWEQVFGEGFRALFAFIYWIEAPLTPEHGMFEHRDRWYLLMGIELSEYRNHMRRRSPKWETVCLGAEDFRQLARPIESWL